MTSLRRQLDAAFMRLAAIRELLQDSNKFPPCCLTFHGHNRISCDVLGPMPEKAFFQHCEVCRKTMIELLNRVNEPLQLELAAGMRKKSV
jgi:hypothetical protein